MPTIEFAGKQIETTEMGYLVNAEDWSEDLAKEIASAEKLELTDRHWDVINHLRDEFFNTNYQGNSSERAYELLTADSWLI